MSESPPGAGLSVHRIEALTDGIYAVAMTLLVIELKLPENPHVETAEQLADALAHLVPKILAWGVSFFVLALFWFGHHRAFGFVRRADGRLVTLCIVQLAMVSLMPFSCALIGEHGRLLGSQIVYSLNMTGLALAALATWRYIHRHTDPARMAMPDTAYRASRLRLVSLIGLSGLAVALNAAAPSFGNMAFMLMALVMPFSRRVEHASGPGVPRPDPG